MSVPDKNKMYNASQLAATANLTEMLTSQRSTLLYFNGGNSRLIVEYIYSSTSEGAQFAPNINASVKAALHSEGAHKITKGFVRHSKLTKFTSLVHVSHIKLFKLSRLIVDSSSEGTQIPRLIIDYIMIPSSEGARIDTSNLIVEFTIDFELAGVCPACIIFPNKPHKLIGKHFIAPTYGVGFQL